MGSSGGGRGVAGNADESTPSSERTFQGVSINKSSGRFKARLYIDRKLTYLGTFGTEEEAARAVGRMSRWCEIHGKMRRGGEAFTYNFNRDEYAGEEVALKAVTTQGEMITKLKEVAARVGGAASWGMSRFKGVSLDKKTGRWVSQIMIDNKNTYLGLFDEEEEAARAYDRMSIWCMIHGKTKKGGYELNFDSRNYAGEEAALTAIDTMEAMVKKIRVVAARAGCATASESSTFRGVSLEKKTGRWRSDITIDNKSTYLGRFDKEDEAARAYDRMSIWCRIQGKTKHGGYKLNFDSSNYAGEEAALTAIDTMEAMVKGTGWVAARAGGAAALESSRFRGVSLQKKSGRWKSQIKIDNMTTYLGLFDEEEEAARAYDRMSMWCKIHGTIKTGSFKLNFDSTNYADEEEELRVCTQADLIKRLKLGKAVSVQEEESVGSGETKHGQKRKQPPHSEDDDDNAADNGIEEADDDSGDAYVADEEKEKEEDKEEVEKEGDDVENEDGSDTSGGSDTGVGGQNLAAELSAVGHIHVATVIVAKGITTIGAEIVTIADQKNVRLCANNNVELGDALYSRQAQAAAAAAAIAVKDHNRVGIINIDGDGDDGVGCGGYMDWTSGAGICSGDRHDAGGGGGGNGGGTVSGGSSHQIVVKIERIEGVPQAMYAGTGGHAEPHGISLAFCASAGEGSYSSFCGGGAEGDAQQCDGLAGKKPASSAVTDGALDGELRTGSVKILA